MTQSIDVLAASLPPHIVSGELLALVNAILQDPETEVRTVACKHLFTCYQQAGSEPFRQHLLGTLTQLGVDSLYEVRQIITDCAARILAQGGTAEVEHFQPFIESAFRDDRAEVRQILVFFG